MDTLTIVKLALFLPLALILAIFAIVYLINGYKKDLGRSLISLGATAVAVAGSLLLAKGISRIAAPLLIKAIPAEMMSNFAEFGSFADGLVQGAIEVVLSFLLFGLFFIISLAVLKSIGKKISWNALNADTVGSRLAGMGVRAVDAVLVTVMLLLPLYGTVAMVAPPAAALLRMSASTAQPQQRGNVSPDVSETAENEELAILEAVADHPALLPYKYGPGSWVYSGLSNFSMNGKSVDVTAAAQSLEGLLDRVQVVQAAIETEDEQVILDAVQEVIDYTRKNVIQQRWSYNMVMALVGELDAQVELHAEELAEEEEVQAMYDQLRPLLDMSFEDYKQNGEALLSFADWLLSTYEQYYDAYDEAKEEQLMQEMYTRIGDLLNCSEQATGLKRILLQQAAQKMFDTMPDFYDPSSADYYAARGDLPNTAAAFIGTYYGDGIVAEKDRLTEAVAFLKLTEATDAYDAAEIFVRHPLFGADAVLNTFDENLYIYGNDSLPCPELAQRKDLVEKLDKMLREYEKASIITTQSFRDQANTLLISELYDNRHPGYFVDGDVYFSGNDVVTTNCIAEGEDGKKYVIPEELMDALKNGDLVLDEETIKKYNLKVFEGYTLSQADIIFVDGSN